MNNLLSYKVLLTGFFLVIATNCNIAHADWQNTLDYHFDIVETFDGLDDWRGAPVNGRDLNQSRMPKKNGAPSMWNFYDYWTTDPVAGDWIANHGAGNVLHGSGKSLRMDLNNPVGSIGPSGPARFGLYFGSNTGEPNALSVTGLPNSGYEDVYVFYFVKFPQNAFPGNGTVFFDYQKFHVMASGFYSISVPDYGFDDLYGPADGHPHIMFCRSYCGNAVNTPTIRQRYTIYNSDGSYMSSNYFWTQNQDWNRYTATESWFAVEFRYKIGTPGNADGKMEQWIYDSSGNATKVLDVNHMMMPAGWNYKFNKFLFGGNLSYPTTSGLNTAYYVDDFIINGSRIGPTYFALLSGQTPPPTPPPTPPSPIAPQAPTGARIEGIVQ